MRGGVIIGSLVVAAALVQTARFATGNTEGGFTGRDAREWRVLALPNGLGAQLFERHCDSPSCELRLLLPRDKWLAHETACFEAAPDTCFEGNRLDYRATLPRARTMVIELRNRDGSKARLRFDPKAPG